MKVSSLVYVFDQTGQTCLCNSPMCQRATCVFAASKDPRRGFVKLPEYTANPESPGDVKRNQRRESYLKYLLPGHPTHEETSSSDIAIHHFHPRVTSGFLDTNPLDSHSIPDYFVPSYQLEDVENDLKNLKIESIETAKRDLVQETKKNYVEDKPPGSSETDSEHDFCSDSHTSSLSNNSEKYEANKKMNPSEPLTPKERMQMQLDKLRQSEEPPIKLVSFSSTEREDRELSRSIRRDASASRIQAAFRSHGIRRTLHMLARCVTTIQTLFRSYLARRKYNLQLNGVILLQSLFRRRAAIRMSERRMTSVLTLQSFLRMVVTFKRTQDLQIANASAARLQSQWRRYYAHTLYQLRQELAITVQSSYRGACVRRAIQTQEVNALVIQARWRCYRAMLQLEHDQRSAIRVQSAFRHVRALKTIERRKAAILTLQSFVRMYGSAHRTEAARVKEELRRKYYQTFFESTCASWQSCVKMLNDGVREIAQAECLVTTSAVADHLLSDTLLKISHKCFTDDKLGFGWDGQETEEMLLSLLKAGTATGAKVGEVARVRNEIGSELARLKREIELHVEKVTTIGDSLLQTLPTTEMIESEKAVKHAWEALQSILKKRPVVKQERGFQRREKDASDNQSSHVLTLANSPPCSPRKSVSCSPFRKLSSPPRSTGGQMDSKPNKNGGSWEEDYPYPATATSFEFLCKVSIGEDDGFPSLPSNSPSPRSVLTRRLSGGLTSSSIEGSTMVLGVKSDKSLLSTRDSAPSRSSRGHPKSGWQFASKHVSASDCLLLISGEKNLELRGMAFFQHVEETMNVIETSSSSEDSPQRSMETSNIEDRWLHEWNYYAVVQQQAYVWNACLGLLSRMCEAAKEVELERSKKLHSMLLTSLSPQRRMFLGVRAVQESAVKELLGLYLDESQDSYNIDQSLQRSSSAAPDLYGPLYDPFALAGGVSSMVGAVVVERKIGLRARKLVLAVVTTDMYLHLFEDIPDIAVGASPSEAFNTLLPDLHDAFVKPTPTYAVNLRNCDIRVGDGIEVKETLAGRFLVNSTRRFSLRGSWDDMAKLNGLLKFHNS